MSQKRKELKKCMKRLDALQNELAKRKTYKRLKCYMEQLKELQNEVDRRQPRRIGFPVSESLKIPHPVKLHEYTICFGQLGKWQHLCFYCGHKYCHESQIILCQHR